MLPTAVLPSILPSVVIWTNATSASSRSFGRRFGFFSHGVKVSLRSEELRTDRESERWGSTKMEDD